MGFRERLFGGGSKRSDPSPEVEAFFKKIRRMLEDEAVQNRRYLPEHQQLMAAGGAVDEVPGAVGDFGRDVRNPIPVNGFLGELVYVSQLVVATGSHVMGHRVGAVDKTDVYETVALDGSRWDLLYFDMYHTRKSRRLPSGYRTASQPFLLATNYTVAEFPVGIHEAMRDCTARVFDQPLVSPQFRDETLFRGFSRPPGHLQALQAVRLSSRAERKQ
jgi:hypothetical protein